MPILKAPETIDGALELRAVEDSWSSHCKQTLENRIFAATERRKVITIAQMVGFATMAMFEKEINQNRSS